MAEKRTSIAEWAEAKSQGNEYGYYVHNSPLLKRRTVVIDRAPPRRVLAPTRYRSFKTQPDRTIWEACMAPVVRLLEDGWRMVRVTVDWGSGLPNTEGWRAQTIRELTGCYDGCDVQEERGTAGRGKVTIEMMRD